LLYNIKLRFLVVVLAAFSIGACSETQLLFHTAKKLSRVSGDSQSQGKYKVGKPYQISGVWYYPQVDYGYDETGIASWYGPGFHGKKTANGETYDQNALTAAHRTLPMPSLVEVTNLQNGRSLRLTVNDRGPFAHGRIIDVSRRASQLLGFHRRGTARVRVRILPAESRIMANQARQGKTVAEMTSPIKKNTRLPKSVVASESLAPPQGASAAETPVETQESLIPRASSIEREPVGEIKPDGRIIRGQPVKTKMYVQVGAFTEFQNAHQTAARLADVGEIIVSSKIVDGREFFRVRTVAISRLKRADQVLEKIISAGFPNARIVVDE
jgi:rare lipoprotein A